MFVSKGRENKGKYDYADGFHGSSCSFGFSLVAYTNTVWQVQFGSWWLISFDRLKWQSSLFIYHIPCLKHLKRYRGWNYTPCIFAHRTGDVSNKNEQFFTVVSKMLQLCKYVQLFFFLTSCAGNWFADHNEWPNRICTIIRQYIILNLSEWYH